MSVTRISKREIDEAKPKPKRYLVMDTEVKGFALKVMPSGAKTFVLQYRMGGAETPTQRYTIGRYGSPWTAETARREAIRLRGRVAAGVDVCAERRTAKHRRVQTPEPDTVEHIFEQFKMRHLSSRRSGKEVGDILEREVVSRWGKRPASEIRRVDVIELLDEIADRGTVYMRNRIAAHVRKLWNFAIGRGIEMSNPAARIEMLDEQARDRVLSADEIRLFWNACDRLGAPFGPLFKLLLVTGQRRDEVGTIERAEVDVSAKTWLIPPAKTKNNIEHSVPLTSLALTLLEEMPEIGSYFFTTTGTTPVSGFSKAKRRLDQHMTEMVGEDVAEKDEVPQWRLHDLRRTFSTGMAEMGIAPHIVEKLLNHQTGTISGVAAVYNRFEYLEERRRALEAWSERLIVILEGRAAAPNVVAHHA